MVKIKMMEQYKELVSGFREKGYRLSNCFFLPDEIKQKLETGTIYFQQIVNGALILDDQGSFFRCYYFLLEEEDPRQIVLCKDAVIEFPYNGEIREKQRIQEKKILALGFRLGRKSGIMTVKPDQIIQQYGLQTEPQVTCAEQEDSPAISILLQENFNPIYAFLPTEEETVRMIRDNRVLIIRHNTGIIAVLISSFEKGVASIRQIAVKEAERGRGFGKALINTYHELYKTKALGFQHWVDLENYPAIQMYRAFGYQFNLRKANEYILIKREA